MRSSHAHAPAFVDPRAREEGELAEDAEGAVAVEACVDAVTGCRGLLAMLGQGGAAKKSERKAAKDAIKPRADTVAKALQARGWAVCDEFAPADLVQEIGKELASISSHYESSEIWVGKDAGAARVVCIDVSRDNRTQCTRVSHDSGRHGMRSGSRACRCCIIDITVIMMRCIHAHACDRSRRADCRA